MEKRLSIMDSGTLDSMRAKAVSLKSELEAASKVRTSPGKYSTDIQDNAYFLFNFLKYMQL